MTHPKRVAVLCYHSSPLDPPGAGDSGGMNVYVRETAARMGASGILVDIYTGKGNGASADVAEIAPAVRVIRIPAGSPRAEKTDLHKWVDGFAERVKDFARGRGLNYGRVVSHYWLSGLAGLKLSREWKAPHVAAFHTLALAKGRRFAGESFARRVRGERRVVRHADVLVAAGQQERRTLTADYGAAPGKVRVVSPGVDRERFFPMDRAKCRRRLGLHAEGKYALFVGRRDPIKGLDVLLEAAERVAPKTELQVLVVGGDSAAATSDRVRFIGPVGHERLPWYYCATDFFVAPSHYESFGMAALEAQACGRAVIASDVGGLSDVVRDGVSGLLVPPGAPGELARALRFLANRPEMAERFGAAGKEGAARYSWERACRRLLAPVEERPASETFVPMRPVEQFAT